jgi:hypothetical protein
VEQIWEGMAMPCLTERMGTSLWDFGVGWPFPSQRTQDRAGIVIL